MFHVIVINADGLPGNLFGPGTWDQCLAKGPELIREELKGADPKYIDRAIKFWNGEDIPDLGAGEEGQVQFNEIGAGAGGVYIIQGESL